MQVAELSARLSVVSQEKARLESRNSVLEKVCMLQFKAAKPFLRDLSARIYAQTSIPGIGNPCEQPLWT